MAVLIGHVLGLCFCKCSSACGVQAELTERGVRNCAFPWVWQRRGEAMTLWCGQESTPSHRAPGLRELWRKIHFLANANMHKFLGVMCRMNHILLHRAFAAKQFGHMSADSAAGGEKSRKIWCASSNWQVVYKKTWNRSIIIIILSRSSLCPVFWVFYRCLKLWNKISTGRILKSSVFAVIGFFVNIFFVFSRFAQKGAHMTLNISSEFHTGGGNEWSVRKYLMEISSESH